MEDAKKRRLAEFITRTYQESKARLEEAQTRRPTSATGNGDLESERRGSGRTKTYRILLA